MGGGGGEKVEERENGGGVGVGVEEGSSGEVSSWIHLDFGQEIGRAHV